MTLSPNPFLSRMRLLSRTMKFLELTSTKSPLVGGFKVFASNTINNAYGNPSTSGVSGAGASELFTVAQDGLYVSKSFSRQYLSPSARQRTQALFSLEDFMAPGLNLPFTADWVFLRTQEQFLDGSFRSLTDGTTRALQGPIHCIPSMEVYGSRSSPFTQTLTAPLGTGCTEGALPLYLLDMGDITPRPMTLHFARPIRKLEIRNTSADDILYAVSENDPMLTIPAGDLRLYTGGDVSTLILASSGAAASTVEISGTFSLG